MFCLVQFKRDNDKVVNYLLNLNKLFDLNNINIED